MGDRGNCKARTARDPPPARPARTVALVGLMGAGKSRVGQALARRYCLPFVDADSEIESAAGRSVAEIFETCGEREFRDGERRVIARLLERPAHVLATGGGAFMDPQTRARLRRRAVSLWLRADLEVLLRRVEGGDARPLLRAGDPRAVLERLIARRYPVYAEADVVVDTADEAPRRTVERADRALRAWFADRAAAGSAR